MIIKWLIRLVLPFFVLIAVISLSLNFYLDVNDYKRCDLESIDQKCPKGEAIVVISGGDTKARTDYGVKLFKKQIGEYAIIFSGAAKDGNVSNAQAMKNIAIDSNVDYQKILIEEKAQNTNENAKNVAQIVKENDLKSITLVTSGYHQKRASKEFKKYLPDGVKIYNAPVPKDKDWSNLWFLSTRGWELALKEAVGSAFVKVD